jgi:hypothetical protein
MDRVVSGLRALYVGETTYPSQRFGLQHRLAFEKHLAPFFNAAPLLDPRDIYIAWEEAPLNHRARLADEAQLQRRRMPLLDQLRAAGKIGR